MKRVTSTWSALRTLVVWFLFIAFISSTLHITPIGGDSVSFSIVKKVNNSQHADTDFPFEETEKELETRTEDKSEDHSLLLCVLRDAALFALFEFKLEYENISIQLCGNAPGIPLYLAKRSLLI